MIMKITPLLLLLLFPLLTIAQQNRTTTSYRFGNAAQECRGRGLCDFSSDDSGSEAKGLAGKVSANQVSLTINRNSLSESDQFSIAGKLLKDIRPNETVYFEQPRSLSISPQTLYNIKVGSGNSFIAARNYPLVITPDAIEITLTLSSKN